MRWDICWDELKVGKNKRDILLDCSDGSGCWGEPTPQTYNPFFRNSPNFQLCLVCSFLSFWAQSVVTIHQPSRSTSSSNTRERHCLCHENWKIKEQLFCGHGERRVYLPFFFPFFFFSFFIFKVVVSMALCYITNYNHQASQYFS